MIRGKEGDDLKEFGGSNLLHVPTPKKKRTRGRI